MPAVFLIAKVFCFSQSPSTAKALKNKSSFHGPLEGMKEYLTLRFFQSLSILAKNNLLTQPKKATDTMGMIVKKMSGKKFLNGRKKDF